MPAFDFQPTLHGDLLDLRPARPEDFGALFAVASDREIWAIHPAHDRWQEPVFRAFFDDAFADEGGLVAIERTSGEIVGFSRYSMERCEPGEVEIGWTFLARRLWGGRYNTEMKRLMLDHAFRFVDTVIFRVGETNFRSRRAVEKIGGLLTDRTETVQLNGAPVTHVTYATRRKDWFAER
ncbi:N-acetyltransferase [Nostoc sp. 3335mG]|nr:N-acetyltransferase [Nostoc sp. 3335mG]